MAKLNFSIRINLLPTIWLLKQWFSHNPSVCFDNGLTFETSAKDHISTGEKHTISTFVDQTHIQCTRPRRKKAVFFKTSLPVLSKVVVEFYWSNKYSVISLSLTVCTFFCRRRIQAKEIQGTWEKRVTLQTTGELAYLQHFVLITFALFLLFRYKFYLIYDNYL